MKVQLKPLKTFKPNHNDPFVVVSLNACGEVSMLDNFPIGNKVQTVHLVHTELLKQLQSLDIPEDTLIFIFRFLSNNYIIKLYFPEYLSKADIENICSYIEQNTDFFYLIPDYYTKVLQLSFRVCTC